jgi:hypothetical protein
MNTSSSEMSLYLRQTKRHYNTVILVSQLKSIPRLPIFKCTFYSCVSILKAVTTYTFSANECNLDKLYLSLYNAGTNGLYLVQSQDCMFYSDDTTTTLELYISTQRPTAMPCYTMHTLLQDYKLLHTALCYIVPMQKDKHRARQT